MNNKDEGYLILKKFIEIQTKKEAIELEEIERDKKLRTQKMVKINESYDNFISLDKDYLLPKIRETIKKDEVWRLFSNKFKLFLLKEHKVNLDLLLEYFDSLHRKIILDFKLKEMDLNFNIFIDDLKNNLKEVKKDVKEEELSSIVERVYEISKKEGLPTLGTKELDRIALEYNIKFFKKDRTLISEMVKNRLLREIINSKKVKNVRKTIPKEVRDKIFKRDNRKCQVCGDTNYLEIGHKMPVAKGGNNSPENLLTLCRKCNSKIGTNIIIQNEKTN